MIVLVSFPLSSYALSPAQNSQLTVRVSWLEKKLDTIIGRESISSQKIIISNITHRLENILQKTLSESTDFILTQIYNIYLAKNIALSEQKSYLVERVIDGDTIEVSDNGNTFQIRLIWVDTPERKDCYFSEASEKLSDKILWERVFLVADESQAESDIYGRKLRYVFSQDYEFMNAYLIESWAWDEYTYNKAYLFQEYFRNLESVADYRNLGKWNTANTCSNISESPVIIPDQEVSDIPSSGWYYTSSYHSAYLYYCANDSAWEGLSKTYLRFYQTEAELKQAYPNKTLNKSCN